MSFLHALLLFPVLVNPEKAVSSAPECLECSKTLYEELNYKGSRNFARMSSRLGRIVRFLGLKTSKAKVVADTGELLATTVWGSSATLSNLTKANVSEALCNGVFASEVTNA